jgi:hypothetical protein
MRKLRYSDRQLGASEFMLNEAFRDMREQIFPAPEAPKAREIKGDTLVVVVPDSIEVIVIEKQD